MPNNLLQNIAKDIKTLNFSLIILKDPDEFLFRKDFEKKLEEEDIFLVYPPLINQRIHFELRKSDFEGKTLLFIQEEDQEYLEDILLETGTFTFSIQDYLYGYDSTVLKEQDLEVLEKLYYQKNISSLNKKETQRKIAEFIGKENYSKKDLKNFKVDWEELKTAKNINWFVVNLLVAENINNGITSRYQGGILDLIEEINNEFQDFLSKNFKNLITSSAVKRPKIVSRILDHLNQEEREKKVALLVIDGLSYWQYLMLKKNFPCEFKIDENITHSWVPSVTELSRQAIFKGAIPDYDYIQNPRNEEKLWRAYWKAKGFYDYEVDYHYNELKNTNANRLAIVLKDLDEKMHGSEDYKDLIPLTQNWIERTNVEKIVQQLLEKGFEIYLTTDHGNIQAKGWRNLRGKEKLGTHNSKSQRHLNYSEDWIAENFLENNPDLGQYVARDENTLYFKNDFSFSSKDRLITHGGSHILEVLIPFIKINK